MNAPLAVDSFTPAGLTFDPLEHRYHLNGKLLLSVTGVLRTVGLMDVSYFTDEDRERGTLVHEAIERYHATGAAIGPAIVEPFLRAYLDFLNESAFRVDRTEERVANAAMMCAGTIDLRGVFLDTKFSGAMTMIDLVDVKTGSVPDWVGYQTAGYARLLPNPAMRSRVRRWCLQLRAAGTYTLLPLTKQTDDVVFVSALTVAQAKRGWL